MSDALNCPACSLSMTAPIKQCKKGHSMCGVCVETKKYKECPVCLAPMTSTRNYQLEEIIANFKNATIKVACANAKLGCKYLVAMGQEAEDHQAACKYRVHSCPGVQFCGWKCPWAGIRGDILQHLKTKHEVLALDFKGTLQSDLNFEETRSEVFPVDYHEGRQLFLCKQRIDAERKKVFWLIQFVGPKNEAQQYYYEIELFKGATRKLKVTELCCSDAEDTEEIFKNERCVSVSFVTAKSYADDSDTLMSRYRVMKVKEESEEDRPRITQRAQVKPLPSAVVATPRRKQR